MNFPPVIFFDLDDTIISFSGESIALWQELCEAYCRQTGRFQMQQLFQTIRETSRNGIGAIKIVIEPADSIFSRPDGRS